MDEVFTTWCKNHQNESFGSICPKKEQLPLNHGILKLDSLEDTAIWLVVDENEITISGYHVHQGKPKKNYCWQLSTCNAEWCRNSRNGWYAYLKTKQSGLPMDHVECLNCYYAHNDIEWFTKILIKRLTTKLGKVDSNKF